MTTPLWCLVAVMFMPVPLAMIGGYFRRKAFGTADNKEPRRQAAQLEGVGARAYAAQQNAWEATGIFTVAVVVTHLAGLPAEVAAPWTLAFVVFRALHAVFYLANIDTARSGTFMGAMFCVIMLLVKAGSL
ncbi:MAG: MAPEG family protein [Myxococcales bacterium]|nr:MAPEG family protein [Myxococcales bacterium]